MPPDHDTNITNSWFGRVKAEWYTVPQFLTVPNQCLFVPWNGVISSLNEHDLCHGHLRRHLAAGTVA